MKNLIKPLLVSLLSVTLILLLPLSVFAHNGEAIPINAAPFVGDPTLDFSAFDMTPGLEAAVGARGLSEVTAVLITGSYNISFIVGAVDNNGDAMLWKLSGETWTDLSTQVAGMKRINDICTMISGVTVFICAGGSDDGGSCLALFSETSPTTYRYSNAAYTAINSLAFDGTALELGITFAPSGFAKFDFGDGVEFPIDMVTAANVVVWPTLNGYFMTGTHSGTILEYGAGFGDAYTETPLPGVADIFDLNPIIPSNGQLAAGMGTDGYAKLFKLNPTGGGTVTGTGVNLPQTITGNPRIGWYPPYALIGGTGGIGHLYKWRQASGMFIDYDYMLSGMNKVNCVTSLFDNLSLTGQEINPLNGQPVYGVYAIGGSGAKKLVGIMFQDFYDIISPETKSTHECGDGTAVVEFPANSVGVAYNATVEKVASGTPPAPGGLSFLGTSYEFECIDGVGQPITEFNSPVTITIHYNDADLNGLSEDSLQIYWYDSDLGVWEAVTPLYIDKVNNFCQVQVKHFSQFAIMGMAELPFTGH